MAGPTRNHRPHGRTIRSPPHCRLATQPSPTAASRVPAKPSPTPVSPASARRHAASGGSNAAHAGASLSAACTTAWPLRAGGSTGSSVPGVPCAAPPPTDSESPDPLSTAPDNTQPQTRPSNQASHGSGPVSLMANATNPCPVRSQRPCRGDFRHASGTPAISRSGPACSRLASGCQRLEVVPAHRFVAVPGASHFDQDSLTPRRGFRVHAHDVRSIVWHRHHRRRQIACQVPGSPADYVVAPGLDLHCETRRGIGELKGNVDGFVRVKVNHPLPREGGDMPRAVDEKPAGKAPVRALSQFRKHLEDVRRPTPAAHRENRDPVRIRQQAQIPQWVPRFSPCHPLHWKLHHAFSQSPCPHLPRTAMLSSVN